MTKTVQFDVQSELLSHTHINNNTTTTETNGNRRLVDFSRTRKNISLDSGMLINFLDLCLLKREFFAESTIDLRWAIVPLVSVSWHCPNAVFLSRLCVCVFVCARDEIWNDSKSSRASEPLAKLKNFFLFCHSQKLNCWLYIQHTLNPLHSIKFMPNSNSRNNVNNSSNWARLTSQVNFHNYFYDFMY